MFYFLENVYLLIGRSAKTVTATEILGNGYYFARPMLIMKQTSVIPFQYKIQQLIVPQ